ncbi:MAG: MBL fold metallo-hydrolase [bacterium]|nr:MBL fold metallo-hydrolase [bacterium]
MKRLLITGIVIALLAALALAQRHVILAYGLSLSGTPEFLEAQDEGPDVRWHDDYFTVQALDENTFAIGEPRFYQQNYSYLIVGSERAVLFDAGPGYRDIRPVAQALTDRPITFIPSHFHYDHVGNQITFEHVAVLDLPYLRARAPDGRLQLTFDEHLGAAENIEAPELQVDVWLAPGSRISLGDRVLQVLYTPGHTEDSVSLLDLKSGDLFTGDFIYPGPLFGMLPNSGMGDYLQGASTVLGAVRPDARVFGAHRVAPPGAPELAVEDVKDLQSALRAIQAGELQGEGVYPVVYRINGRVDLYAEPGWLQNWTPRHPEAAK